LTSVVVEMLTTADLSRSMRGARLGPTGTSAAGAGVAYFVLPKTEVVTGGNWRAVSSFAGRLGREGAEAVKEYPADLPWTPDAVAAYLEELFAEWEVGNPLTREPVTIEDSPGNFTVIEDEGTMVLRVYLLDGSAVSMLIERPTPGAARGDRRQRLLERR
jgi:hypothetical protein